LPIYQIDLETLPITAATFPLLMCYKGNLERGKAIMQFFIEHYQVLEEMSFFMEALHSLNGSVVSDWRTVNRRA
jgi:hypothetical protein